MSQEPADPRLPLGRAGLDSDAAAPDGSEIRFLIDRRHGAGRASMVHVTLPAGQVSRPVRHRTVEEIWYVLEGRGQVWRCPPGAPAESVAPALRLPWRCPCHTHGLVLPVRRRRRWPLAVPVLHLPTLARPRRSSKRPTRRPGPAKPFDTCCSYPERLFRASMPMLTEGRLKPECPLHD